MNHQRTLLATFVLTAMWAQAAFDPSKAVADVVLAEDLNSLRISLSEAGYEVRFKKPPMEGAYGLVNKKSRQLYFLI